VRPVAPKNDQVPESSAIQPILIGSPFGCAAAGEGARKAKAPIVRRTKNTWSAVFLISCSNMIIPPYWV